MIAWAIVQPGRGPWRYVRAEGPCWKGEIGLSFRFFHITLGWQAKETTR